VTSFVLRDAPVLSRSGVLRDETLRTDVERQRKGWPSAQLVVVDARGRTPVVWEGRPATGADLAAGRWDTGGAARLDTRPTSGDGPPEDAVLLGEADGTAYWAVRGEPDPFGSEPRDDEANWADLRTTGAVLDALGAGLFTTAAAALNWHAAARFCPEDGSPTRPVNAGWHRHCEASGHELYPRTDPAVICLVHDGGTGPSARVLLARAPAWPAGRYSVLAGFVEAGESLEACVVREIHEEVGVHVRDLRYLGSQSWPFPRSLMVAFHAVADPDAPLVPADGEIAEAMWATRADLQRALDAGDWAARGDAPFLLPGRVSIARTMLESWAALA
jgi:NAD+ diphosphatase